MHKCPNCGVSQYKVKDDECSSDESTKKGPLTKVLRYLPIIPRFKGMFAIGDDAKDITWHADERNYDGMLHHRLILPNGRKLIACIQILGKGKKS